MPTTLFSATRVGAIEVANHVVMAPLTRNRSPGAIPTALAATYYAQRADPQTGAGLIVSEATAISPQGQGYADVPGLYGSEQIDGWKKVTHAVHDAGGKIVFGATVELEDEESGDAVKYQIVGEDEADLKKGLINVSSPIARALIGKEEGDMAEVQAPGGVRRYEVIAVSYI